MSPDATTPSETCPQWCTRVHHADDHAEDRMHLDDGRTLPAIVATHDVATELTARPATLTVQLVRPFGSPRTWVRIQEAEGAANRLVVDLAGARALAAAIDLSAG